MPKIMKLSTFVKVMQRKLLASFFPDTVYIRARMDIHYKLRLCNKQ